GESTTTNTTGPANPQPTTAPGGGDTPTTAPPTSGSPGGMALAADCARPVQLQYWNPFTGPDGPFMGNIVESFNGSQPDIQVVMTSQGEYATQLSTAAASDTLPDVAVINEDAVATSAFRNIIRPIDDLVAQSGISGADFPAVAWNAGEVAGKRYAIPLSFVAMTMFYNEDLLKAAGLSAPPATAAEFDAAATAMTKDGNNGFLLTTGFPIQQIFQQLLHQFGGTEFSADGTKATWNSDAGVQALQWMVDAQKKYGQPNLEVDAELNAFKSGTVGMIWNGIWQSTNVTGDAVEFAGKAASVPQIGPQPAVWAGGPLLALPVHKTVDPCKDTAAMMFIDYLIDNSLEWAKAGNIPASNAVRNSAEFKALPQAPIAPSVENPVFPPSIPGIGEAFAPLNEAIASVMSGGQTDIKAALDAAAGRADQILADNRSNYGEAPK
ncbi:MAG TPA: ABC transporter substrate-binding protein, partial [Herpetosiphonaceae bacterium]|nr:ABC transporter substrate-binding protein [Herpetosiphonaceae bacterium]